MAAKNQKSKFILQVYDGTKYRPCYTAPHGTSDVFGDVKVADDKIAVPADTTTTSSTSSIVPSQKAVSDTIKGALENENLPAARAKLLTTGKTVNFSHQDGGDFKATWQNALSENNQKVVFSGTLPLNAIPKGAMERLYVYKNKDAALAAAKAGNIQQGDVAQIPEESNSSHNLMYYMKEDWGNGKSFDDIFAEFSAGHATSADNATYATSAGTANKLGSTTIGGGAKPIYLNNGTATACSSTVGGTAKPVYMNSGTITACSSTVGDASTPVYMNGGTITACTPYSQATVKSATNATNATNDSMGNTISSTYVSKISINDQTITFNTPNGTKVGTITLPTNTDTNIHLSSLANSSIAASTTTNNQVKLTLNIVGDLNDGSSYQKALSTTNYLQTSLDTGILSYIVNNGSSTAVSKVAFPVRVTG